MLKSPQVSIITPCFNAGSTLPMALASLVAQSFQEWECLVVDDGSSQAIWPLVEAFDDPRIRQFVFEENRGRSVARQVALDNARGDFICMLDADDWYYPDKLERQVAAMQANPDLAALSMGMAIVDDADELLGVRDFTDEKLETFVGKAHQFPKIPFPPVMIRREIAQRERFEASLKRSEDFDYMMRILDGRKYGAMREVGYVYREVFSDDSMGEALSAFRFQRRIFGERATKSLLMSGRQYLWSLVKTGVYGASRSMGRGAWLFERRNRQATEGEDRIFEAHREMVREALMECEG